MTEALPLFYFPTTICWIDDDDLFLEAIKTAYAYDFGCKVFSEPSKAVDFFSTYTSPLQGINFTRGYVESDEYGMQNHSLVDLNVQLISNINKLSNRHDEISLLVIDYTMPNMNGLQLCEKLKNTPFKKILLTGVKSHAHAIEAFNKGLIDCYIKKDSQSDHDLKRYLRELTYQYFCQQTANLVSHLEVRRSSQLSDPKFIKFFRQWCDENKIKEFYLLNKEGGFITINDKNEYAYFIIINEYDAKEFVRLNDESLDKAGYLLNRFSEGKLIPFFGIEKEYWEIDLSQWESYFYPANIFEGREHYYWAVIKR